MTVDFVDLDWVIIALFMRVNLLWKMEFSCIRKGNWVGEGLADFSFYVWVGGLVLLARLKHAQCTKPLGLFPSKAKRPHKSVLF